MTETQWHIFGVFGQMMFFSRFLVQWLYSERAKQIVIPGAFWYLSLFGGAITLTYAFHREEPVFAAGQVIGLFVYSRNLWLHRKGQAKVAGDEDDNPPGA